MITTHMVHSLLDRERPSHWTSQTNSCLETSLILLALINLLTQAAHVGVGISGREGLQATLASDYAIAQVTYSSLWLWIIDWWYLLPIPEVSIPGQVVAGTWSMELQPAGYCHTLCLLQEHLPLYYWGEFSFISPLLSPPLPLPPLPFFPLHSLCVVWSHSMTFVSYCSFGLHSWMDSLGNRSSKDGLSAYSMW